MSGPAGNPPLVPPKPPTTAHCTRGSPVTPPPVLSTVSGIESAKAIELISPAGAACPNHKEEIARGTAGCRAPAKVMRTALSSPAVTNYNHALTRADNALKLASASDFELLATGKPMSLKEFGKVKKARDMPCLVKVAGGQHSLCDFYSLGQAQMFVVLEKKSTLVATCRDQANGNAYVVPVHTVAFDVTVPTASLKFEQKRPHNLGKITAQELLQCQSLPPVMAVSEEFALRQHSEKTLPVGTLLFPKEMKKRAKDQQQGVLHAKSENDQMVRITPDCKGCFSVLATDVRLSLQEAVNHLKLPFTMRTISDCDTLYANTITVERVHKEDLLVGMMKATEGTTIDDIASFTRMAEVPVSLSLTVVMMVPKEQKTLERIYDFAYTGYYGVMNRPDGVVMDSNPSYGDAPVKHPNVKHDDQEQPPATYRPAARQSLQPIAKSLPSTPMQYRYRSDTVCSKVDHIYDSVDYFSMVTAAPKQMSSSSSKAAGTPIMNKEEVPISMCQEGAVNDSEANIAYLKTLQAGDILQLLDSMNLSAYKDAFEQEQIDGDTMSCLNDEMLIELGVSKSLHRLRLMKIVSGQICAKSFMCKSTPTAAN